MIELLAFVVNAQCTNCPNPSFGPSSRLLATGFASSEILTPRIAVAAGDFNHDGFPDIALLTTWDAPVIQISILLGSGDGSFSQGQLMAVPEAQCCVLAAADFDGDGSLDLAYPAGNINGGEIGIARGNGDGTFQTPQYYPGGQAGFVSSIVIQDFNNDGVPDIAVPGGFGIGTALLLGNGTGGFGAPIVSALWPNFGILQMAAADFNSDGILDLAVTLSGPNNVYNLAIAFGDGRGSFSAGPSFLLAGTPSALTTVDANTDGHADVVVVLPSGLATYLGDGSGGFSTPIASAGPTASPSPALVTDFDGDGVPDLVVHGFGEITIFHGDGQGGFAVNQELPVGTIPSDMALADINLDGRDDLISADGGTNTVSVFLSQGAASFVSAPQVSLLSPATAIAAGDLNGDGLEDLVVVSDTYPGPPLAVFFGTAPGVFGPPVPYSGLASPAAVVVDDVNHDSFPDVIVLDMAANAVAVFLNDGTGNLLSPSYYGAGTGPIQMAPVDINQDGNLDLIVGATPFGNPELHVLLGNGSGAFADSAQYAVGGVNTGFAVADFNGDGFPDVALPGAVYLNDGLGNLLLYGSFGPLSGPISIAAGDFDGDGKVDLVINDRYPDTLKLFRGDGAGGFSLVNSIPIHEYSGQVFAVDINGDGKKDVALITGYRNSLSCFMGDGTGGFWPPSEIMTVPQARSAAVVDLNNDGRPDFVIGSEFWNSVSLLTNTGCEARRLAILSEVSACNFSGSAFTSQPFLEVTDDGGNIVTCGSSEVTAAIVPGSGTPGAQLNGTVSIPTISGIAQYSGLSIDLPGQKYRLQFTSPGITTAFSRTISQDVSQPVVSGPSFLCSNVPATYSAVPGYDSYEWQLNNQVVSNSRVVSFPSFPSSASLELTVTADQCLASSSFYVSVAPAPPDMTISAPSTAPPAATGLTGTASPAFGLSVQWALTNGTITGGQGSATVAFDAGPAGSTMLLTAVGTDSNGCSTNPATTQIQVDFLDVPASNPFHDFVDSIARNGITGGCGGGNFCPNAGVLRSQMAVFLLRAEHGSSYLPPACTFPTFTDVPCSSPFASWIYQLVAEAITSGCTATTFCPADPVQRDSMAVFLLVTEHGSGYTPPACTPPGQFTDVPCPGGGFTDWIYQLVAEGVTGGCTATSYCPTQPVSRAQMSAFLVTTFSLP
jgi:hypothetical protein